MKNEERAARKLIVGNWKMNCRREEGESLARAIVAGAPGCDADLVLCPPFTLLAALAGIVAGSGVALGAQDCHAEAKGAFTGDIAAGMLADLGASHVIVGHSERRVHHHEGSEQVRHKAMAAIAQGLVPIICVGETLEIREAGHAEHVVARELERSLPDAGNPNALVIAYEPIWAIGSGKTCGVGEITAMHAVLQEFLARKHPSLAACRILYGGSVKAENAAEILALRNVDGALVGGASLDAKSFLAIAGQTG